MPKKKTELEFQLALLNQRLKMTEEELSTAVLEARYAAAAHLDGVCVGLMAAMRVIEESIKLKKLNRKQTPV
jgi:hypothetical protein